jgi:hypothetical protein
VFRLSALSLELMANVLNDPNELNDTNDLNGISNLNVPNGRKKSERIQLRPAWVLNTSRR